MLAWSRVILLDLGIEPLDRQAMRRLVQILGLCILVLFAAPATQARNL
jgi:hypothetical protein